MHVFTLNRRSLTRQRRRLGSSSTGLASGDARRCSLVLAPIESESGLTACVLVFLFSTSFCRYLRHTSQTLLDKFGGDIPDTVEGLISLKGVGPKMAHLVMQIAWKK